LAAHTRYLCKRLRARCPDLRIIVGRWGLRDLTGLARRQLEAAGASYVGATLVETHAHLQTVYGLEPPEPAWRERTATGSGTGIPTGEPTAASPV
jgi:hypothetical protein